MSASSRRRSVKDFQFGNKIGEGSYSTVYKAVDVYSRKVFAIKILSKAHIVKEKKIKYVNIEKQTLNRLGHHPGIVTLYYTFQDESSLFFVIDFAEYGELLTLIRKLGTLNEVSTKYYMIQLVDAIKFMHSKGVIHRDLKPENILLNHDMKLMITDFGAAKMLDENGNAEELQSNLSINSNGGLGENGDDKEKAASFVGTAEYVSPELLQHNECGYESDIWAVGCILYQFIVGLPPFKGSTEYLTFEKIIGLDYKFPNHFIPDPIKHLITNILVIDPKKRYTIKDVQEHQFFKNVPWTDFNYIWKRNPPKIEAYDPRTYANGNTTPPSTTEVLSKPVVAKQPINFYKKAIANPSKTLDIINSTYVPSSNHMMPTNSPKKNVGALHQTGKGYPKINQFNRNAAIATAAGNIAMNNITTQTTPSNINSAHVMPAQNQNIHSTQKVNGNNASVSNVTNKQGHAYKSQTQTQPQQTSTPPHPLQSSHGGSPSQFSSVKTNGKSHEKQNSQSSNQTRIFKLQSQQKLQQSNHYVFNKPLIQGGVNISKSQPTSPISFNLSSQSNLGNRSVSETKSEISSRINNASSVDKNGSGGENQSYSPIEKNGSSNNIGDEKMINGLANEISINDNATQVKDSLAAANEAIQIAQKFRAKNLFASTSSYPGEAMNDFNDPKKPSHPYAPMRLASGSNSAALSPFMNGYAYTSNQSSTPIEQPVAIPYEGRLSLSSEAPSGVSKNQQYHTNYGLNHSTDLDQNILLSSNPVTNLSGNAEPHPFDSLAKPEPVLSKIKHNKSLTLDTGFPSSKIEAYSEELTSSPKSPRDIDSKHSHSASAMKKVDPPAKNSAFVPQTEKLKIQSPKICPSPVIYFDDDIEPEFEADDIPPEITQLLYADEKIIKLGTIVVSHLSFEDILETDPNLSISSVYGSKLDLNDATINEIIGKHGRVIDYYSKPEVMIVTTLGRLFILQSIKLSNRLYEIKLTDNKISLYDYEFDEGSESNYGYLLVELIDKQCLLFLSPHDHKRVTVDFETNTSITWIECLFKAKQLLRPKTRKKCNMGYESNTENSSPTNKTGSNMPSSLKSSPISRESKLSVGSLTTSATRSSQGTNNKKNNSSVANVAAAAAAAAAAIKKEHR